MNSFKITKFLSPVCLVAISFSLGCRDSSFSGSQASNRASPNAKTGGVSKIESGGDIDVSKVGINFEDVVTSGDKDFNDAVLCFSGFFTINASKVVSSKAQKISATTSNNSDCSHNMRVEVSHQDGSKEPSLQFDSRATSPILINLKAGSILEVFMTPYLGDICTTGVERNMHDADAAKILPDVCNGPGK